MSNLLSSNIMFLNKKYGSLVKKCKDLAGKRLNGTYTRQLQSDQQEQRRVEQERMKLEQTLSDQSNQARQELESVLRTLAQRVQEVATQLLGIQQQAAQVMTQQVLSFSEERRALQFQHGEREEALTRQLQAVHQELRHLEQDWAQHEKALNKEIATLQREKQEIDHVQQLQAQHHNAELKSKLDEHKRLIEAFAALEAKLNAEILLEQQTSQRLRQSLAQVQQSLATTHASLTWRMTAPLRILGSVISPPQKNRTDLSKMTETESSYVITPSIPESQLINVQHSPIESIMFHSAQATNQPPPPQHLATTLDELLSYHDQQFVHCAFHTLLGRDPDPEGLGYYLGRVSRGFSKMRLVAQLRLSKEGRAYAKERKAHGVSLPGLDQAIKRYQRGQYLFIGGLFRWLYEAESNHPTERKLRGIENQLFLLSDESNRRFNQIEQVIAELSHHVEEQTQSVINALNNSLQNHGEIAAELGTGIGGPTENRDQVPKTDSVSIWPKIISNSKTPLEEIGSFLTEGGI